MKIVHTSDWHAGRYWKGIHRLNELEAVLDHLAGWIDRERVDLLLMSGDVFDNGAPNADAERAVFSFFKRVGQAGTQTVVIAGNHDSADRIRAWGTLAELVGVRAVGKPCPANEGGLIDISVRSGEKALVAVLPFAPLHRMVSPIELAEDDTKSKQLYASRLERIAGLLCKDFRTDTVNLFTAHTHLDGAKWSGSERSVHLGDEWAATPQSLPSTAQYVALGHIHRPQRVEAAPGQAHYAGSALQLDFGEIGEEKSFVVISARPGRPAHVERVPYVGARCLQEIRGTLAELERDVEQLRERGWLRVVVPLEQPDADVSAKVRRLLPNALVVNRELPQAEEVKPTEGRLQRAAADVYAQFYREKHGAEPSERLMDAFAHLYEAEQEEGQACAR